MTLTLRDTTYRELAHQGYPQETFGQQASEATRVFLVPWESRQQAALDFLGYVEEDATDTTPPCPVRVIPDAHLGYVRPDGKNFLWADSVTFEPYGQPVDEDGIPTYGEGTTIDDLGEPVYNFAKMTVHYSTRLYRILSDEDFDLVSGTVGEASLLRYVETPFAVSAQYLTLPDGTFAFANASGANLDINGNNTTIAPGTPVPGAPGKIEGQWDVTMIWRQVPRSMVAAAAVMYPVVGLTTKPAAFDWAIGRVNNAVFAGYPAGTLLCEPPELAQWVQADGVTVFDVTFHFKYFARGWNYFAQKGQPDPVTKASKLAYGEVGVVGSGGVAQSYTPASPPPDGAKMYDSYDFHNLFYGYWYTASSTPP